MRQRLRRNPFRHDQRRLSFRVCFLFCSLVLVANARAEIPFAERRSGYEFMGRETRAMQDDETTGPAVLWLLDGEALWSRKAGEAAKACADCHGDARASMKGVAARFPAFDSAKEKIINLDQR